MCHEARDNVKCCTQAFRLCHTQTHLPTLSDQAGSSCMREMCYHPHSCHHPHSAGYGRSPHVSVTAQIRTPLSLLVGSCRPQLVSPSALSGIWSLAARVCHRSDPHASVTARGFVSPSARVTIRTLRDMVARRTCLSPLRSARLCHCSWVRVALSSCHHPHSAGYGRSPHVSVTAQIRTPLSLLVGSRRPQLVSPSALCGIWSLAARVCHRSDPHASVTARGFVSPSARVTIRTLRDMVPHSPSRSHCQARPRFACNGAIQVLSTVP